VILVKLEKLYLKFNHGLRKKVPIIFGNIIKLKIFNLKPIYSFSGHQYDLLDWNCNNFSDEFSKYLLDSTTSVIPEEILELPRFVKTT